MVKAVVGLNWGDEGKGRIVDYFATGADCVIRYQGGDNAGHTVVNNYGKFALHNIPSGIFNEKCLNIIAPGSVLNPGSFIREKKELDARNIKTGNIIISDRATIILPYHIQLEKLEEDRLKGRKFGSTLSGISPVYSLKHLKKSIQAGELLYPRYLKEHAASVVEYVNMLLKGIYKAQPVRLNDVLEWLDSYGRELAPFIADIRPEIRRLLGKDGKIILEAQLGALRDINHGIYPYTTSSSTLAGYACASIPVPPSSVSGITGVTKAYSTCVGEGPFVTEMEETTAHEIREKAGEYGAKTGRPRRIGHFDAVATAYGCRLQGATDIALTCLDVLSGRKELEICTAYRTRHGLTQDFPINPVLYDSEPVYEKLDGWVQDISGIREYDRLPLNARRYVERIEQLTGVRIGIISVGPEREALIIR